jgi:hypothetical protein
MSARRPLLASIVGACLLVGCSAGDEGDPVRDAASGSGSAATPSPPADASPGRLQPGGAVAAPSGSPGLHPDSGALPEGWPAAAAPEHGAEVWAVYLAIGPAGDPALAEAAAYLEDRGYSPYDGREIGCDGGAAEALGRDRHEQAVAVYFAWRADAGDFLTLTASNGKADAGPFVDLLRVTLDCAA